MNASFEEYFHFYIHLGLFLLRERNILVCKQRMKNPTCIFNTYIEIEMVNRKFEFFKRQNKFTYKQAENFPHPSTLAQF